MLLTAILLFVIAAVFGLIIFTKIMQDRPTPKLTVIIHGGLSLIALLIVIYYVCYHETTPLISLVLFIAAAFVGLVMFYMDMRKKPVPKWLALVHPLIVAIALLLLIVFVIINH